ncbi:hypothetical protein niasHT_014935 [Heterodera trifolii]|uniref:Guanylate kinase-like domain-containing protein n=1 Tax=Heterodera trifolii TaxID=157864 RepID=A0ABD2LFN5_9BILA
MLRNAEYAPFVVFIGAPDLHGLLDPDGSLERLVKESELLRQSFGHLFDCVLINNGIDETILEVTHSAESWFYSQKWEDDNDNKKILKLIPSFGHIFVFVLINNDIDETIRQLESVVEKLSAIPQWVPVSWVY